MDIQVEQVLDFDTGGGGGVSWLHHLGPLRP